MKKLLIFAVLIIFAFGASAGFSLSNEVERQAVYGALNQAAEALKSAPFGEKSIAVLPLKKEYRIFTGNLKNMLVNAGFTCVEEKSDRMWDAIIDEIAWDERKDDILDPATVVKFGKLTAAQILLQFDIRVIDRNAERVYAEIDLRATEIATARVLWGSTFAYRYYIGKDVNGIIDLSHELRMVLKKNFASALKSLKTPEFSGKFKNLGTITVVPVSGDIDGYVTGLSIEMLTQTDFKPQTPPIPSLSQVRATVRDGQLLTDAVFYGAIRALHKTPRTTGRDGKLIVTEYDVIADIQLFIEDSKTGSILWSKTITMKETISEHRDMTPEELEKYRDEKFSAVPGDIAEEMVDNWQKYLKIAGWVLGGIILFALIIFGIKAFVSYNDVR